MQKIREQVLAHRDKVYEDNEGEVRKRWHFEDAVSLLLSADLSVIIFLSFFLSFSHSLSPFLLLKMKKQVALTKWFSSALLWLKGLAQFL